LKTEVERVTRALGSHWMPDVVRMTLSTYEAVTAFW
jgi:hypothetical protein